MGLQSITMSITVIGCESVHKIRLCKEAPYSTLKVNSTAMFKYQYD